MLLNRLVNALSKAIQQEQTVPPSLVESYPSAGVAMPAVARAYQMEGPQYEDKTFWKCYFNAVSCFKR